MKTIARFSKDGVVLMTFEMELESKEHVQEAFALAHEAFRKQHPDISLYDGVSVLWTKG